MKSNFNKLLMSILAVGLTLFSCNTDSNQIDENLQLNGTSGKISKKLLLDKTKNPDRINWNLNGLVAEDFGVRSSILNAVEPSECGPTPFREVLTKYDDLLWNDFLAVYDGNIDGYWITLADYFIINQIAALDENKNADYFGDHGQYTAVVQNQTRNLENFWNMPNMVQVRGQHTATLEDLDFIRYVYDNYSDASNEIIDYVVQIAEQYNNASTQIPENPFYASDGFATFDGFIVIGDGLVSMLAEVEIDTKVVWSSILAHEWAHQIQFLNYGIFEYPIPPFIGTPESTRMTELEADFYTGYYLTHKRGGTYNWKRVEGFLQAFFEIGDCSFGSRGHHGTPIQRMEAARQGFLLAQSEQKKGIISSAADVHEVFVNKLDGIVGGE